MPGPRGGVWSGGGVPGLGKGCLVQGCLPGPGVPAWSGGVPSWSQGGGIPACTEVWGCLVPGGCLVWGVPGLGGAWSGGACLVPGVACLVLGGVVSQHALRQTPPVNRILDTCF